jgi:ankyrin repeat protein
MKDRVAILIRSSVVLMMALVFGYSLRGMRYGWTWHESMDQRLLDGLRLRDYDQIETALASGASPNAAEALSGHSALIIASSQGDLASVGDLLARGASVDLRDRNGATALAHAAYWGHVRIVHELIQSGAAVDALDSEGLTPLAHALILGQSQVVQLLLQHGAQADHVGAQGITPLMVAAESPHASEDLIRLLLDAGADPARIDTDGRSALNYACDLQRDPMIRCVLSSRHSAE